MCVCVGGCVCVCACVLVGRLLGLGPLGLRVYVCVDLHGDLGLSLGL